MGLIYFANVCRARQLSAARLGLAHSSSDDFYAVRALGVAIGRASGGRVGWD